MKPTAIAKMRSLVERFRNNHPKFSMFAAAASNYVSVGSIIEINIQDAEGKSICTNIRVTEDDIELMEAIKEIMPKK